MGSDSIVINGEQKNKQKKTTKSHGFKKYGRIDQG